MRAAFVAVAAALVAFALNADAVDIMIIMMINQTMICSRSPAFPTDAHKLCHK